MDHRSLGRCDSHDADLGLRLPLVELAETLTPGCHMSPLRGWGGAFSNVDDFSEIVTWASRGHLPRVNHMSPLRGWRERRLRMIAAPSRS
jgi:hypothetical protein